MTIPRTTVSGDFNVYVRNLISGSESFRVFNGIIIVIILLVVSILCLGSNGQARLVGPYYEGRVVEVNQYLDFKLDCCEFTMRLNQIERRQMQGATLKHAQRILMSQRLQCSSRGSSRHHTSSEPVQVWCNFLDGKLVSNVLKNLKLSR